MPLAIFSEDMGLLKHTFPKGKIRLLHKYKRDVSERLCDLLTQEEASKTWEMQDA